MIYFNIAYGNIIEPIIWIYIYIDSHMGYGPNYVDNLWMIQIVAGTIRHIMGIPDHRKLSICFGKMNIHLSVFFNEHQGTGCSRVLTRKHIGLSKTSIYPDTLIFMGNLTKFWLVYSITTILSPV